MFSAQEEKNIKEFPDCIPNPIFTEDLIFLYPKDFIGKPEETLELLQRTFDLLKKLTDLNPTGKIPSETNPSRITIGFHKKCTQLAWTGRGGNCIYIPWKRINDKDEPQAGCTHELVHPFYRISELQEGENEVWGEPFCDFLRGPLKNNIGLDGIGWWKEKIKEAENKEDDNRAGTGAGLLILEAKEICRGNDFDSYRFVEEFIDDYSNLRDFIQRLRKEYSLTPLHSKGRFFLNKTMKDKLVKIMRKKGRQI